ncbi:hypothetical protein V6N13_051323 [Hibiscus sabdariffa]
MSTGNSKKAKSSQLERLFSLMGIHTVYGYFFTGYYVVGVRSRWCESRVWQPLGHRTVSLEPPCPGIRNPGRHYRQVWDEPQSDGENGKCCASTHFLCVLQELARRLAPSGRYKCRKYKVSFNEVIWTAEADCGWGNLKQGMFPGKLESEVTEWWRYTRVLWHKWRTRGTGKDGKEKDGGKKWFEYCVEFQKWWVQVLRIEDMFLRRKNKPHTAEMEVLLGIESRVPVTTMSTWEWRESTQLVQKFAQQPSYTWTVGPGDDSYMMSIEGTFPEPPFQPPTMSFMHGLFTQTLRKAQKYRNRLMMGLGINYGENFREVGSPLIMDSWINGAHTGGITIKRGERFTLIYYGLHGVYVNTGLGPDKRESNTGKRGGPDFIFFNTVGLKMGLIGGCKFYLKRWSPFLKMSRSGEKSVKHLGLTKCNLVDFKAGYTKDMAEEVIGLMENLKFSEVELVDVSNNEEDMLEPVEGSEKWVVGDLPRMARGVSGTVLVWELA